LVSSTKTCYNSDIKSLWNSTTSARPSGGSTQTQLTAKSTPAKTDAQINKELAAVQAGLDEILKM
jgi:hypothetical protein